MKDDSGHFGEQDPDFKADLESMKVWSPWTKEQIDQLNAFQTFGTFHPFTCPEQHEGEEPEIKLVALAGGWVCPDQDCDYTQDWAWEAMFKPESVTNTDWSIGFPPDHGCLCEVQGTPGNWHIVRFSRECEMHRQLRESHLDSSGTQEVLAQRPLHMVKEDGLQAVMKLVGDPNDPNPEFKDAVKQLRYRFDGAEFNTKTLTITLGVREDAPDHVLPHILQTFKSVIERSLAYTTADGLFEGLIKYEIKEGE